MVITNTQTRRASRPRRCMPGCPSPLAPALPAPSQTAASPPADAIAARAYVLHHCRVTTLIAQAWISRSSTRQFSNPSPIRRSMYSVYVSSLDARRGRGLGRIASGDFRACPCGSRGTSAPCCATRPAPGQSPGSNGPLLSARKSLSLVPPCGIRIGGTGERLTGGPVAVQGI